MQNIKLRPINEKDNSSIARIIRDVLTEFGADKPGTVFFDPTTDHLFELFSHPKSAYFIAELNGTIVGGSGIYPTHGLPADCCELVKLYLIPQMRGRGVGGKLMEKCFHQAALYGFQQLYLETMPELRTAIGLYEKTGFTHLSAPLGNSGHFGCDLWMIKQLF